MRLTKPLRLLLVTSGLVAAGIGAAILVDPASFHASNGIVVAPDASLLSELRAPGGALLVLGAMMLVGAFRRAFAFASTSIAAAVYLAYGASRVLSFALDGLPATGLVGATAIELALGAACAVALVRAARRAEPVVAEVA